MSRRTRSPPDAKRLKTGSAALEGELAAVRAGAGLMIATEVHNDSFVAMLGHELRGKLQPARNATDLLLLESRDAATQRYLASVIDRQIAGMTRLVEDLLSVAHVRAGMFRLRLMRTDVAEIIGHAVEAVRPLVDGRNQTLIVRVPSDRAFLDADGIWLCQALQNLLANATKYTDLGGVIEIGAARHKHEVVISVSDSGIGIAPADLEGIFNLYMQTDQAGAERSRGGIGIGLYLCRLVIEAHGGGILASSPGLGLGSLFTIRLPLPRS